MRGLVIVLMALDHASGAFNGGRLMTDSAHMYRPGMLLAADQFLTRWLTHLCAPTFVFLAGAALALSIERRVAAGEPARRIDRYLLTRGLLIAALDPAWMSLAFTPGRVLLQVLYAIGMSLVCMIGLRRLPTLWLAAAAILFMVGGEAIVGLTLDLDGAAGVVSALLVRGGRFGGLIVGYPLLAWLPVMMLGWAFGRMLCTPGRAERRPERGLAVFGLCALALFALVRGLNGYGNMGLPRDGDSIVQWLHVSKYPPGISFFTLELGIMALVMAAFFALSRWGPPVRRLLAPLLVPGQTALFFYVLHVHLLELVARALGVHRQLGLGAAYLGMVGIVLFLFPFCLWYRRYKARHPNGWARYL
jgi:uncharacterized membrane protein